MAVAEEPLFSNAGGSREPPEASPDGNEGLRALARLVKKDPSMILDERAESSAASETTTVSRRDEAEDEWGSEEDEDEDDDDDDDDDEDEYEFERHERLRQDVLRKLARESRASPDRLPPYLRREMARGQRWGPSPGDDDDLEAKVRPPTDPEQIRELVKWGERLRQEWALTQLIPPCWMAHHWGLMEFKALKDFEDMVKSGKAVLSAFISLVETTAARIDRQWAAPCTPTKHITFDRTYINENELRSDPAQIEEWIQESLERLRSLGSRENDED